MGHSQSSWWHGAREFRNPKSNLIGDGFVRLDFPQPCGVCAELIGKTET